MMSANPDPNVSKVQDEGGKPNPHEPLIADLRARQPSRRWRSWKFNDKSGYMLEGYSRSRDKTFLCIQQLQVALDGGYCRGKRMDNVFVTHTHFDHSYDLGYMCTKSVEGGVRCYVPKEGREILREYVKAGVALNACSPYEKVLKAYPVVGGYQLRGVQAGDVIEGLGKNRKDWRIRVFQCFHAVPCVGYAFSSCRPKLKPEYQGLPGRELGTLRKQGIAITEDVWTPRFVYVGDTHIRVFEENPWLLKFPIIITECTFLRDDKSQKIEERCERDGHTCWELGLEKLVVANPSVTFVLIHFSLRYTEPEIFDYFKMRAKHVNLSNIVLFVGDMKDA